MVDVEWALDELGQIYQSEDHLKLALGAELARMYGTKRVRLEWNPQQSRMVDLGVRRGDVTIPIEVKYKTDAATVIDPLFEEQFDLQSQGAQTRAHYRIFRDVHRVEQIVGSQGRYGYMVLLTNDTTCWSPPTGYPLYAPFGIHEGAQRSGRLAWPDRRDWMEDAGIGDPIDLSGTYTIEWSPYSYRDDTKVIGNADFRYMVFRVD